MRQRSVSYCFLLLMVAGALQGASLNVNHANANADGQKLTGTSQDHAFKVFDKSQSYCVPHPSPCVYSKRVAMRVAASVAGFMAIEHMSINQGRELVKTWMSHSGRKSPLDPECFWKGFEESLTEHYKIYNDRYKDLCTRERSKQTQKKPVDPKSPQNTHPVKKNRRQSKPKAHASTKDSTSVNDSQMSTTNTEVVTEHVVEYFEKVVDDKRSKELKRKTHKAKEERLKNIRRMKLRAQKAAKKIEKLKRLLLEAKKRAFKQKQDKLKKEIERTQKKQAQDEQTIIEETTVVEEITMMEQKSQKQEEVKKQVQKIMNDKQVKTDVDIKREEHKMKIIEDRINRLKNHIRKLKYQKNVLKKVRNQVRKNSDQKQSKKLISKVHKQSIKDVSHNKKNTSKKQNTTKKHPERKSSPKKHDSTKNHQSDEKTSHDRHETTYQSDTQSTTSHQSSEQITEVTESITEVSTSIIEQEKELKQLEEKKTEKEVQINAYKVVLGNVQELEEITQDDVVIEEEEHLDDEFMSDPEVALDVDIQRLVKPEEIADIEYKIDQQYKVLDESNNKIKSFNKTLAELESQLTQAMDSSAEEESTSPFDNLEKRISNIKESILQEESYIEETKDDIEDSEMSLESLKWLVTRTSNVDMTMNTSNTTTSDIFNNSQPLDVRKITKKMLKDYEDMLIADEKAIERTEFRVDRLESQIASRKHTILRLQARKSGDNNIDRNYVRILNRRVKTLELIKHDLSSKPKQQADIRKQLRGQVSELRKKIYTQPKNPKNRIRARKLGEFMRRLNHLRKPNHIQKLNLKKIQKRITFLNRALKEEKVSTSDSIIQKKINHLKKQLAVRNKKISLLRKREKKSYKRLTNKQINFNVVFEGYTRSRPDTYYQHRSISPRYLVRLVAKTSRHLTHKIKQLTAKISRNSRVIKQLQKSPASHTHATSSLHSHINSMISAKLADRKLLTIAKRDLSEVNQIIDDLNRWHDGDRLTILQSVRVVRGLKKAAEDKVQKLVRSMIKVVGVEEKKTSQVERLNLLLKKGQHTGNDTKKIEAKKSKIQNKLADLEVQITQLKTKKEKLRLQQRRIQRELPRLNKILDQLSKFARKILLEIRKNQKTKKQKVGKLVAIANQLDHKVADMKKKLELKQKLLKEISDVSKVVEITEEIITIQTEVKTEEQKVERIKKVIVEVATQKNLVETKSDKLDKITKKYVKKLAETQKALEEKHHIEEKIEELETSEKTTEETKGELGELKQKLARKSKEFKQKQKKVAHFEDKVVKHYHKVQKKHSSESILLHKKEIHEAREEIFKSEKKIATKVVEITELKKTIEETYDSSTKSALQKQIEHHEEQIKELKKHVEKKYQEKTQKRKILRYEEDEKYRTIKTYERIDQKKKDNEIYHHNEKNNSTKHPDVKDHDDKHNNTKHPDVKHPDDKRPDVKRPDGKHHDDKHNNTKHPDVKHHDDKHNNTKHPDVKHPDDKHPGVKLPQVKHPDVKHNNTKHPDVKHHDDKHSGVKHPEVKHHDDKHNNTKHPDVKHNNTKHPDVKHHDDKHNNTKHPDVKHYDYNKFSVYNHQDDVKHVDKIKLLKKQHNDNYKRTKSLDEKHIKQQFNTSYNAEKKYSKETNKKCSLIDKFSPEKPFRLVKLEAKLISYIDKKVRYVHSLSILNFELASVINNLEQITQQNGDIAQLANLRKKEVNYADKVKSIEERISKYEEKCQKYRKAVLGFKMKVAKSHCKCCESDILKNEIKVWNIREQIALSKTVNKTYDKMLTEKMIPISI